MYTLCIVSGDVSLRNAVKSSIEGVECDIVEFDNAVEFTLRFEGKRDCCFLIDVDVPGMDSVELHQVISQLMPSGHVVVTSEFPDIKRCVRHMRLGASDYILHSDIRREIKPALMRVMSVIPQKISRRFIFDQSFEMFRELSPAERKVAELMAMGKLTKQISAELGRSYNTIKIHKSNILRKTGIRSTAAFVSKVAGLTG